MFKHYRFIFALIACLCGLSCGIAGTAFADDVAFKVYAKQLILDGSLNMAFFVPISDDDLSNTNVTKSARFTIGSEAEKDGTFRNDVYLTGYINDDSKFVVAETDDIPKGKTHTKIYAFVGSLTSVQMADNISATITVGNKTANVDSYTVKDYLNALTTGEYSDNVKALANALKDYGHFAQITLSETNTEAYTKANHTPMPNSADKVTTDESYTQSATYNAIYDTDTKTKAASYTSNKRFDFSSGDLTGYNNEAIGFTLDLDSETNLIITNLSDDVTIGTIIVSSDLDDLDPSTATITGLTVKNNELAITDIAAHELGYQYSIPVTVSGKTYTIKVSPMSYIHYVTWRTSEELNKAMKLNDENKAVHLQNAVIALYNYYKAERTYRSDNIYGR